MNLRAALVHLRPSEEWVLDGDSLDGLTWLADTPAPTQAELDAAWVDVQQTQAQAEADRVAAIQSAQAELQGLGLGDAAIATISGYPYPYAG